MRARWAIRGTLAALAVATVASGQAPEKSKGIESEGYKWNEMVGEKVEALHLKGDAEAGEDAYEVCGGCHLPSGAGRDDGTFPQLAGQHGTVLIKQLADIREGRRDNPIMYPFAKEALENPQGVADVAAYIQTLPIPRSNGKGPGTDLARGGELYKRDCVQCHGPNGEGNAEKFYPVLAGQHYAYLLRQINDIAEKRRRNANPDMVKVVETYKPEELQAVVDYMSRLEWPERQAKTGAAKAKEEHEDHEEDKD
jgi:cytochrome c553